MKEVINNKEDKIINQINIIQKQLNDNVEFLNNIKLNNDNYILLQVKIDEDDLNEDIRLFNQVGTYKYYFNFERDDIETIIDNQMVNIKYKKIWRNFEYYWNFTTTGINNIKIIFKKKLLQCNHLFSRCDNIYKIDCSNFDCSQIIDCSEMFRNCSSLKEINLGKLDFALSTDFSYMFR